MRNFKLFAVLLAAAALAGCEMADFGMGERGEPSYGGDSTGESSGGGGGGGGGQGGQGQAGVITAGEWCDPDNWSFWEELMAGKDYGKMPAYWSFFHNNRVAVDVETDDGVPVVNSAVALRRGGAVISKTRTNNKGRAELWVALNQFEGKVDFASLSLEVDDVPAETAVTPYDEGVCKVIAAQPDVAERIEIAFMVDATGSMGDELEFLKTELVDVIGRAGELNSGSTILTGTVFYRDEGDQYVTKVSPFTEKISETTGFISQQQAHGGGDFPEAVHTALDKTVNELQWTSGARTKIMFIVLDAPPHYEPAIITSIHTSIEKARETGIRIIPITASGIDKQTEFLMRFLAISTNGTYVFVTDDSGVGNPHLEPSVGQYAVEKLNDLMVRLIGEYSE